MPDLSNLTQISLNWTFWQSNLFTMWTLGYERAMGFVLWPMIFSAWVAYIYIKNQSAVSAVAGIIVIFSAFGTSSYFLNLPWLVFLFQTITCIVIAGLFTYFFSKRS